MARTTVYQMLLVALLVHLSISHEPVDFPALLDADDISYYFANRDLEGLHWALSNVFARSARNPNPDEIVYELPEQLVSRGGGNKYTTAYKLRHDREQAEYLASTLSDPDLARFFRSVVLPTYDSVLSRIPSLDQLQSTQGLYPFQPPDHRLGIGSLYNKALYVTDHPALTDEQGNSKPLLHPDLNQKAIVDQWNGKTGSHPGIVSIDNLLTAEALSALQSIMHSSTVWYQTKLPLKFGGYVGAYIDDGLHDPLLLQLALELSDKLPFISGHPLRYLWAYKYDSDYTGINLHADQAAVNVNIWLTPDEANLDPDSGGLVVYTAKPPLDWDFADYNTDTDRVREQLLAPTGFANVTIPYRTNRAVIFDSALFHQTDNFRFRPGYQNRRINLTLLYGEMKKAQLSAKEEL